MTAPGAEGGLGGLGPAVVVDASVVVEYLVEASLTAQAQAVFRASVDDGVGLWAPDLVYAEVVSALRRLVALRALTPQAGDVAVEDVKRLPLSVTGTRSLVSRAWQLRAAITSYDACYVALAEALGAPLVTADRKLARVVSGLGPRVAFLGELR